MRARAAPVASLCDKNAAGVDDDRVAQRVFPQQSGVGADTIKQVAVVIAGDEQVLFVNQFFACGRFLECFVAAPGFLLQVLDQLIPALGFKDFEL